MNLFTSLRSHFHRVRHLSSLFRPSQITVDQYFSRRDLPEIARDEFRVGRPSHREVLPNEIILVHLHSTPLYLDYQKRLREASTNEFAENRDAALVPTSECKINPVSSRVCERGTPACITKHTIESPTWEKAKR